MNALEYIFSRTAPKNKGELCKQLDFHFHAYIKSRLYSLEEKDFLKSLVKSKWGMMTLLKDIYGQRFHFESEKEMSSKEMMSFLESLSELGKTIYENMSQKEKLLWGYEVESEIAIAGKYYFQNDLVTYQDVIRLETFFRIYLSNKLVIPTSESEKKLDMQYHAHMIGNIIRNELLSFASYIEHIQKLTIGAELTEYLHFLLKYANDISHQKGSAFLQEICKLNLEDTSEPNAKKVLFLIQEALWEIVILEDTKNKVRSILLWSYNGNHGKSFEFRLIPENNFYFRKHEEIFEPNGDIFPKNGNMLLKENTLQNVCVFHPNGQKVYWWDLSEDDFKNIKWTYYILDEGKWWRDVPKYAKGNVTALSEVPDPYFEKIKELNPNLISKFVPKDVPFLLPEYMRTFAIWKIEKWEYTPNPKNIDL